MGSAVTTERLATVLLSSDQVEGIELRQRPLAGDPQDENEGHIGGRADDGDTDEVTPGVEPHGPWLPRDLRHEGPEQQVRGRDPCPYVEGQST